MSVGQPVEPRDTLPPDFTERLQRSLAAADGERQRRLWLRRARNALPLVLLVGPLLAWRLMLSTPDGTHVAVGALAWTAFLLDLGVHVDTSLLSFLGLSQLPSIVGALLMVMLTATLLWEESDRP
jgi:hypothetical protein